MSFRFPPPPHTRLQQQQQQHELCASSMAYISVYINICMRLGLEGCPDRRNGPAEAARLNVNGKPDVVFRHKHTCLPYSRLHSCPALPQGARPSCIFCCFRCRRRLANDLRLVAAAVLSRVESRGGGVCSRSDALWPAAKALAGPVQMVQKHTRKERQRKRRRRQQRRRLRLSSAVCVFG